MKQLPVKQNRFEHFVQETESHLNQAMMDFIRGGDGNGEEGDIGTNPPIPPTGG